MDKHFLLLLFLLAASTPSLADTAFPPENISECGKGTSLNWAGPGHNVRCQPNSNDSSLVFGMDDGWPDVIRCKEMGSNWIENVPLFEVTPDGSHVYALDISGQGEIIFDAHGNITHTNGWGLGGDNTCFHHTIKEIMDLGWGYYSVVRPGNAAYNLPLREAVTE